MQQIRRVGAAATLCMALVLATATAAQAAPEWEVKGPGPWHVLPVGESETLVSKGSLKLYEVGSLKGAKCKVRDGEGILNEPLGGGGHDLLFPFEGECHGAAVFPCTASEHFTFSGNERATRLIAGPEDEILVGAGPWLVLHCLTSKLHESYEEGAPLHPVLAVNKLIFAGVASGTLKAGAHEIDFEGKDKLKPALYKKVR